jgi:membrane-associated phospholipid phosphatase
MAAGLKRIDCARRGVLHTTQARRRGEIASSSGVTNRQRGAVALTRVVLHVDLVVLRLLRTRCHWHVLERMARNLSRWGEHSRLWFSVALAGAARDPARRGLYARLAGALAVTELLTAIVKLAVDRPRPSLADLPPLTDARSAQSCPSAHASTSFAAARLLCQALPASRVYLAASAMAFTRPYLGVHYPSDVVAGAILGTGVGEIAKRGLA